MQLKSQHLGSAQPKTQKTHGRLFYVGLAVTATGAVLLAPEVFATSTFDLSSAAFTALPGEAAKVYTGLLKVIPLAIVPAAGLAAMRGGMGFMAGLVGMALRAG